MSHRIKSLPLRPYQHEALDSIYTAFSKDRQRVAVVLPTGLGKTVIFANLAEHFARSGSRVMILVHQPARRHGST